MQLLPIFGLIERLGVIHIKKKDIFEFEDLKPDWKKIRNQLRFIIAYLLKKDLKKLNNCYSKSNKILL